MRVLPSTRLPATFPSRAVLSLLLVAACSLACRRTPLPSSHTRVQVPSFTVTPNRSPTPNASAPSMPPRYEVGGDVLAPVLITKVEPEFPATTSGFRFNGTFLFETVVDETGRSHVARTLRSPSASPRVSTFEAAARTAIEKWRYRPGTLHGTPVPVTIRVSLTFRTH
mgnify:CR=1 FL=1